ncbi:unnamed protein product [Diatraea saccharalis]|uniref:C-type lectin domain-containing protein n=1 Tax=Diatraea saccharalis TaxID=40085 RepID=A0A9N9WF57_9NEOP|nr:unnamed protein product [Diatraea saccharalis]
MANRSYIEVIVLCVLTIIVKEGLAGEGEFRLDYTYSPEANGWIKFHGVPATWFEARLKCYYEGAVLMSPINYQLYSAMKSLMLSRNNASFTGVNSLTHTGDYKSIEGINFLDMPIQWAKGEPDNLDDNERCLAILPDGSIADVKCEEVRTYMCYKERFGNETITECGTSDKEYKFDHRTGSCYKFHPECVTWWRAYMACSSEGGHLVIVNNETEANVLYERYSKSKIYCRDERFIHIGFLMQIRPYWFTVDLHEAGYDHWAPNEPNNVANRESCGALYRNNNGLNDWSCDGILPFVCELSNVKERKQLYNKL